ncbi:sugar phosphate nucleotidyltransferase [Priestia megaterium]|uniref:sugar phosphate nucleotidyltransferase n=1 Tax=Priestia megaterium TaxID=1404 RepID=UPI00207A8F77|nr:sugar phosphate nucleotidyltransferase [Priestia megaterium]USL44418.1 mannose-1-phosphate guanylyltransferase [Priestia megaterium]
MHLILLSGGSGKRLWPLSNDSRSKQFLKLLDSDYSSTHKISMIQRTWQQLQKAKLTKHAIISTSKAQVELIGSQLSSDIPLIIEPSRRDTYPAIVLACIYLYCVKKVPPDEVVVILPVDSYVENDFFYHVNHLEEAVLHSNADLALLGSKPTFPSEKYGYIVPNTSQPPSIHRSYQAVNYFAEKPNQEQAKVLLKEGALWNSGIFAFKLKFMLNHLEEKGWLLNYEEIIKKYDSLPKNSFDYEVVEKTNNIVVIPYKGQWKDLGTWNTLTEEMTTPLFGKGTISSDCENVHVINELDIPVSVLGLSNLVVAVSPDGILVSDKEASPRIKEIVNQFEQRPMYEERTWGWYRVLDYDNSNNNHEVLTKRIGVLSDKTLSYQKHFHLQLVWTIICGTGLFTLNNKIKKVKTGDILQIPLGVAYSIKAITDLELIEVKIGVHLFHE